MESLLSGDGSYTEEVVLCLGLVEAGREMMSQRHMEPVYYYNSVPHIMGINSEQTVAQLH